MEPDLSNPEQIKALIKMLQGLLPEQQDTQDSKKSNIKTKTKKATKDDSSNKFLSMPERDMHKADSRIDKKLRVQPPCPRNRKFKTIEVTCRSCGKKENVNPIIIPESVDRYKCNKCSSSAGG